ncbi:eukaryotic translation initiation factor 3 subunit G-B-like [Anoplophora glabripennis]|uniref:eukaryotic translation initiation factor 3 subunit G-B-like n=1 Tax=Anoplophora glabripennis TaxID=217634 RepID=UPI000873F4AF|nr:eukaryotic translation initiation factor 3 subunit G-B-like [Anoplophora glabripennis]
MSEESRVVRIVNLDETFTNETLKTFILTRCQPNGDIQNLYLKRDDINQLFYGYIVFEHSYDAVKVVQGLNGYVYGTNQFEVELIGPNLKYNIFPETKESDIWIRNSHRIEYPLKSAISARKNLLRRRTSVVGADKKKYMSSRLNLICNRRLEKVSEYIPSNAEPKVYGANKVRQSGRSYACVCISGLHYSTTESDLAKLVQPFGPRKSLRLVKDKGTGVRSFAFVHFKFKCDAAEAISQLNGINVHNRILKVEWSRS